jgi:outer membrane protein OmpA-like peptidoglycan-associated protein
LRLTNSPMNNFLRLMILGFFAFSVVGGDVYSQGIKRPSKPSGKAKKYLNKGRKEGDKGNFQKSANYYRMSVEADSLTFDAPMELGYTYFNDLKKADSAVIYLRLAERNMPKDSVNVLFYYIAQSYQLIAKYDDAIRYYSKFSNTIDNTPDGANLKLEVLRAIQDCRYARDVNQRRDSIVVENIGNKVNSNYPDYIPVVYDNDSILLFTSRRASNKGHEIDDQDGKFYEDMYISKKENGEWSSPIPFKQDPMVSRLKNTSDHESLVFLSYDEKGLITYKKDNLWYSKFINGAFEPSERMPNTINIGPVNRHASMTADGSTIYFSSDKAGGLGGYDIYRAYRNKDGSWGEAENLGPAVNTKANDDSPVITADGSILYFASQGHLGYGGYDVFRLEFGGDYNTVVNMGTPINSAGDDIYFKLNKKLDLGYFASNRDGGTGETDIYRVKIIKRYFSNCVAVAPKEYPYTLDAKDLVDVSVNNAKYIWQMGDATEMTGRKVTHNYPRPGTYWAVLSVVDSVTGKNLVKEQEVEVAIKNVTHIEFFAPDTSVTNEEVAFNGSMSMVKGASQRKYKWDFGDGQRADSMFATHTYNTGGYYEVKMEVEARDDSSSKSYVYCVSKNILILSGDAAAAWLKARAEREKLISAHQEKEPVKEISATKLDSVKATAISLENVYFDLNRSDIREDAKKTLDENIRKLKENPGVKIYVAAHTDARGSAAYNKALSARRANSVIAYLRKQGISSKRITSVMSYGESKLINDCGDGKECEEQKHQMNRRAELIIVR